MSILFSKNLASRSLWFLFAILASLHLEEIAGVITGEEYSSESVFEEFEDPLKNDLSAGNSKGLADFRQGHRHFRRHHRGKLPNEINMPISPDDFHLSMDFPRSRHHYYRKMRKDPQDARNKNNTKNSRIDEPVVEKSLQTLPNRFSYVAQKFYQYVWEKRNNAKKDDGDVTENEKNPGNDQEVENNSWNEDADNEEGRDTKEVSTTATPKFDPKKPPTLWRNIIDVPQCPSGQRKDANGRCRVALW